MSLRKKKTQDIINAKRRRVMGGPDGSGDGSGFPGKSLGKWEKNSEEFARILKELCPQAVENKSLGAVSLPLLIVNELKIGPKDTTLP